MTTPLNDVQHSLARLLVVDDDPRLLLSLCSQLRQSGFEVNAAEDGQSAFKELQRQRYDLILLDLHMPRMNGHQLMSRCEKSGITIPVIVVSGLSSFSSVRRAFRRGAYDYVQKPYRIEELISTIQGALSKHRREQTETAIQRCAAVSEAFHRNTVNRFPEIVFGLDRENRFCFVNDQVSQRLGHHKNDLIGRPFQYLLEGQEEIVAALLDSARSKFAHPETRELRLRIQGQSAVERFFEVTIFPFEAVAEPLSRASARISEWTATCLAAELAGVARDVTEQKEATAFLSFQASHDLLTRLPNRVLFRDRVDAATAQALRNNKQFTVMFIDLNGFKQINDNFGHAAGDRIIHNVAQRLKGCLRAEDTLARFGGDEFTLLLPATPTRDGAQIIADKLIQSLHRGFIIDQHAVRVGASIGIALYPQAGGSVDALLRAADSAMYLAKKKGGTGYAFHDGLGSAQDPED